jgi:signal transduction histidine kinase
MNLSTRLLAVLLPTVGLIMLGYSALSISQRREMLIPAAQRETLAYATVLAVALESRRLTNDAVQDVISQASRVPKIYGIVVYDSVGRPLLVSDTIRTTAAAPGDRLKQVLEHGETVNFEQQIDHTPVYSVLHPIRERRGRVTGVVQVAQSMALLVDEQRASARRAVQNTLTLFAALIVVTVVLVRRFVGRPLERFLAGVRALERGELSYRLDEDQPGGELATLEREFNRMTGQLQVARLQMIHEAEERLALERRLRESEKLAAVGNLATGLAHEIGAPLNVISGRADLVLKEPLPQPQRRNVEIIIQQIDRIATTVRSLLGFARRREPSLRPMDLTGTLADVAEFMDSELQRRDIRLVRTGESSGWIIGDPDLLYHVFVNLFLNAMQAMEGSDGAREIRVCVGRSEDDAGGSGPAGVLVEVTDSGPGFKADELERIFQPFYSTKDSGTGLGLVIARSIVEAQGGTLDARNRADAHGAVFRCVLRAAPEGG